ncbi:MAG: metallophosphoesterase family protein [Candidatus Obscuribacterales bacterium]|nr:metallophosphoesterase family protein [Candidatus Obscuribacterales bacterium]
MLSTLSEELLLVAFFAIVGTVLGLCLKSIRSAKANQWKKKLSLFETTVLLAGLTGCACVVYGFIEPFRLEVTTVRITSVKLPKGSIPLRLVQLTDLHCDGLNRVQSKLAETIKPLKPDLIVFTGDAANNSAGVLAFKDCMRQISAIAPTFGVAGNNDFRGDDIFAETPVVKLEGKASLLEIHGTKVWINGVPVNQPESVQPSMNAAPIDMFDIFLYHYPAAVLAPAAEKIDLLCVGHTHGGQVRMPFVGALVTNSQVGKQYEYGLYHLKKGAMFVSRGIGMIALPVRFLAPPEIVLIEVVPEI